MLLPLAVTKPLRCGFHKPIDPGKQISLYDYEKGLGGLKMQEDKERLEDLRSRISSMLVHL